MPAAIAIPAIIGAAGVGAQVAGSAIQAHSANKAAKAQEQASNQALDFSRGVYNDQMRMVDPYVQMGTDAFSRLYSQHYGVPYAGTPYQGQPSMPGPGQAMPRGGMSLAHVGQPQQAPMMGGGQMVQLRAPNGDVSAVPAHLADQFIARGAQRVG